MWPYPAMHSTTSHFQRRGQAVSNKQTMATWRLASGVEGTLATHFAFVKPQWFVNETLLLFHLLGFYFFFLLFSYCRTLFLSPWAWRLGRLDPLRFLSPLFDCLNLNIKFPPFVHGVEWWTGAFYRASIFFYTCWIYFSVAYLYLKVITREW
jgi:hypothetical protein